MAVRSGSGPVRLGYYRVEVDNDTWTIPMKYRDLKPIGIGGFSTVWLVMSH